MADIDREKLSSNVRDKYQLENNTFSREVKSNPKDRIQVEIGDSRQIDFKPQAKIMRWDEEVNFSLRAEEHPEAIVETEGKLIKYITPDYEVHQYELDPGDIGEDGGLEFEWVLPKKPSSNVLTATIQTKGLNFFFQPPLTQKEIDEGAQRPENVVGSYAVYHATKGGMNDIAGMEYKTGKAFHIFRPKITDANGNETWGELSIDEQTGLLSVTIDQTWLDNAVYPVVVDPTFGYTSIGASIQRAHSEGIYVSGKYNLPENGDISKLTRYSADFGIGDFSSNNKSVIYTDTSDYPDVLQGTGIETFVDDGLDTWVDLPFSPDVSLTSNNFWLGWVLDDSTEYVYDTSEAEKTFFDFEAGYYTSPPDPFPSSITEDDIKASIYATYTASGGTGTASVSPLALEVTIPEVTAIGTPGIATVSPVQLALTLPEVTATGSGAAAGEFDFLQATQDTSDTSEYTFSSENLGTADADRYIIVAIMARKAGATTTITGVTVGGVTATIVKQQANTSTNTDVAGIAIAAVPTGTTGDIVVTFGATMVRAVIGVYRAVGLTSATPTDTGGSTAGDPTYAIDVEAGGFAIGCALANSTTTTSWTGVTEDYDGTLESFVTYSGGSDVFETEQTDTTLTADFTSAGSEDVGVFASWGLSAGGGTGTASVSPVALALTIPEVTATSIVTASVALLALEVTIPEVTSTYTYVGTASVSPLALAVTLPEVTALSVSTASVSPVALSLTLPEVTALSTVTASVEPLALALSIPEVTASYTYAVQASVAPVALSLTFPEVTGSYTYTETASVAPLSLTITIPEVTATYEGAQAASVSPVALSLTVVPVTAIYTLISSASVAQLALAITLPEVTATYTSVMTASVEPLLLSVTIPEATALSTLTASVEPVVILATFPEVTADYVSVQTASGEPLRIALTFPEVVADYASVSSATVFAVQLALTLPEVTATYIDFLVEKFGDVDWTDTAIAGDVARANIDKIGDVAV